MNSLQRHLVVAGLVGSLGLAAVAQSQTPSADTQAQPPAAERAADNPDQRRDFMQKKVERKLGKLKQQLQITPAQESAWNAWAGAVQPGTKMQRSSRAELAALTTPERIDRMRAARTLRNAEIDRRLDATKSFYAALTAEQQKAFDEASLRFAMHHHGKRGFSHRG
ncbi:Spy/CpxP family protein refolding chaperone [Ramlibacter sp. PS3R-8]|uniref:Spy/CpxP family protein refolding chaperone n=1 Tax=Ramlibacter sp. PS3R-8 TaxID=3133437 RepID=UPI0030961876